MLLRKPKNLFTGHVRPGRITKMRDTLQVKLFLFPLHRFLHLSPNKLPSSNPNHMLFENPTAAQPTNHEFNLSANTNYQQQPLINRTNSTATAPLHPLIECPDEPSRSSIPPARRSPRIESNRSGVLSRSSDAKPRQASGPTVYPTNLQVPQIYLIPPS